MDIAAVFHSTGGVSALSAQSDLRCAPVRLRTQDLFSVSPPLPLLPHLGRKIPEHFEKFYDSFLLPLLRQKQGEIPNSPEKNYGGILTRIDGVITRRASTAIVNGSFLLHIPTLKAQPFLQKNFYNQLCDVLKLI